MQNSLSCLMFLAHPNPKTQEQNQTLAFDPPISPFRSLLLNPCSRTNPLVLSSQQRWAAVAAGGRCSCGSATSARSMVAPRTTKSTL